MAQSDIDGIVALYGANTTDMADAGTGTAPPDTGTPDDSGATPATPTTPTADAGNGGAGGCGGTQTAAGDGATGTGADAGKGDGGAPHGFGGDLGGRFADLASLLNSFRGDHSDAAAASGADLHGCAARRTEQLGAPAFRPIICGVDRARDGRHVVTTRQCPAQNESSAPGIVVE